MQFAEAEVSRLSNAGSCSTLEPPSPPLFSTKRKTMFVSVQQCNRKTSDILSAFRPPAHL